MAFVVEDGTGLANANAFISVAYYRDYHTTRGRVVPADPTLPDATIQTWIVRATDYIVKRWQSWQGELINDVQVLPFPREGVVVDSRTLASDSLPLTLQQATAEYALIASGVAELAPTPPLPFDREDDEGEIIEGGGPVTGVSEQVDVIKEAKTFAGPDVLSAGAKGSSTVSGWIIPAYPAADLLIEPLTGTSKGAKVIRN